MRVAIIPTGKLELLALPEALGRLFPGHEFFCVPFLAAEQRPFDGFTTSRLPPTSATRALLDRLVEALAGSLFPDRAGGERADFAVLLDDLELANADQPGVVVDEVRCAVMAHMARLESQRPTVVARTREALRDRASFHLAVPMIESWILADPKGAARAGVPVDRLPPRLAGTDPEAMRVDDDAYLGDDGSACDAWRALTGKRHARNRPAWIKAGDDRTRHPKAYVSWLHRQPGEKDCTAYRESHEGRDALLGLDWPAALANPEHCGFMRSFVADLADALGVPLPFADREVAGPTARDSLPRHPVLRNV